MESGFGCMLPPAKDKINPDLGAQPLPQREDVCAVVPAESPRALCGAPG